MIKTVFTAFLFQITINIPEELDNEKKKKEKLQCNQSFWHTLLFLRTKRMLLQTHPNEQTHSHAHTLNLSYLSLFGKVGRRAGHSHSKSMYLTDWIWIQNIYKMILSSRQEIIWGHWPERKKKKKSLKFDSLWKEILRTTANEQRIKPIIIIFQKYFKWRTENCNITQYWLSVLLEGYFLYQRLKQNLWMKTKH